MFMVKIFQQKITDMMPQNLRQNLRPKVASKEANKVEIPAEKPEEIANGYVDDLHNSMGTVTVTFLKSL